MRHIKKFSIYTMVTVKDLRLWIRPCVVLVMLCIVNRNRYIVTLRVITITLIILQSDKQNAHLYNHGTVYCNVGIEY